MLFDLRIVQSFLWLGGPSGKESALRMQEIQEMRVQSLDREDAPEKSLANPLHCSCLRKPMDRGAWRAIVHGVTEESEMT